MKDKKGSCTKDHTELLFYTHHWLLLLLLLGILFDGVDRGGGLNVLLWLLLVDYVLLLLLLLRHLSAKHLSVRLAVHLIATIDQVRAIGPCNRHCRRSSILVRSRRRGARVRRLLRH